MKQDLVKLGSAIKALRKGRALTLSELAKLTGLTAGLLSKIENFRCVPSLPVLLSIAAALDVAPAKLLEGIGDGQSRGWILTRRDKRSLVEREESLGFTYESLLDTASLGVNLQIMALTVAPGAKREMVVTDGDQIVFMLEGELDFWLGEEKVGMRAGDLLFFDGGIPHVPVNDGRKSAVLLAIYLIRPEA